MILNKQTRKHRIKESIDPFKGLKEVKSDVNLKSGKYVSDGWGGTYEIPTKGYSQIIKLSKDISGRYNFSEHTVELLYKKEVFASEGLEPGNWFDNPEYWVEKLYDNNSYEIKEMIKFEKFSKR